MDERYILILQFNDKRNEWEDVTKRVCWFNDSGKAYEIEYIGASRHYWKRYIDLKIFTNPVKIDLRDKIVYNEGEPQLGVTEIVVFGKYVKLFFGNCSRIVSKESVKIVSDISKKRDVKNLISYLKEIAVLLPVDEGQNFLINQLEKLTIPENSVLGKFLQGKLEKKSDKRIVIFPFDTNSAQRLAVKRALEEDLSIIQGPPGTGKTETIRNIVANYVTRGGSVAVVSGNNEAIRNVKDKFEAGGFGFLNAFLGKVDNVKAFFEAEPSLIRINETKNIYNENVLKAINKNAEDYLTYSFDIARINQTISEYAIEKEINDVEYQIKSRSVPKTLINKKYTSTKLLELSSMLEVLSEKEVGSFFNRARFLFRFGIIRLKEIIQNKEDAVDYLKNKYYSVKITELKIEEAGKREYIRSNNLEEMLSEQKKISMSVFNACLRTRYETHNRSDFTIQNYKRRFVEFTNRYPIIYSTTHAIRSCSANNYLYDCVIIDESRQVDLVSAVLAFSVAKKVVLVGDERQLPHVVKTQLLPKLNDIFLKYDLENCFDYSTNSILSCVLKKNPNIVSTLLNEHYRCDPQIIGFCNKRFYNGELVVRTEHTSGNGVTIISHGSHFERNRTNEREVDIIEKEIIKNLPAQETGIIAPYNNQINLLKSRFGNIGCVIDTIHKFQGKEKDYIILSTVANKIRFYDDDDRIDFLNNPNLINVAISRAKKRLYILASEETLKQNNSILRDLSKYYEYYCSETKVVKTSVFSVFDLMYDDYAPVLENMKESLLKISSFSSENIIATVINDICKSGECGALGYKFNYPLKFVIKSSSLSDVKDIKFVSNINTHCDFLIYNRLNKEIVLVVEVDGSQHKEEVQVERDKRKDRLLTAAGIRILRLSTTTVDCREKIVKALISAIDGE